MTDIMIIVTEKYYEPFAQSIVIDQSGKLWLFNDNDVWARMKIGKTYKVTTGIFSKDRITKIEEVCGYAGIFLLLYHHGRTSNDLLISMICSCFTTIEKIGMATVIISIIEIIILIAINPWIGYMALGGYAILSAKY